MLDVHPLTPYLGAELGGVDLSLAMEPHIFQDIYAAFLNYQVIVFRGQDMPLARQVEFARRFGEVQIHVMNQYHVDGYPEIYYLSNLDAQGNPSGTHPDRGTLAWHTDGSWRQRTGHATVMFSDEVPSEGGNTEFCDMYGALEKLPDALKAFVDTSFAVHNLDFSRTRRHGEEPMTEAQKNAVPPVAHPMSRTHPETGRRSLYLGDHAEYVKGMDYQTGRELIDRLNNMAIPTGIHLHSSMASRGSRGLG